MSAWAMVSSLMPQDEMDTLGKQVVLPKLSKTDNLKERDKEKFNVILLIGNCKLLV